MTMPIARHSALLLAAALLGGNAVAAAAEPACRPQATRLPPLYAKAATKPPLPADERLHLRQLAAKGAEGVEVSLQEIDLSGSGACDLVATVRDPLSSGGDSDVLTTIYLAKPPSGWQRVGAVSARRDDRPASLELVGHGEDAQFAFSEFRRVTLPGDATVYLVAWHGERIANGFDGYRVFLLDRREARLRPLDRWAGKGREVYQAFKAGGAASGFDARVEMDEIRRLCAAPAASRPALAAADCTPSGR
ncbi:hypothetical protein [Roseateles sp.]|uniref:hypothetical protein n=1 Tax=Roseateles sp. TaxID=1971397 RepID=UPI0032671C64